MVPFSSSLRGQWWVLMCRRSDGRLPCYSTGPVCLLISVNPPTVLSPLALLLSHDHKSQDGFLFPVSERCVGFCEEHPVWSCYLACCKFGSWIVSEGDSIVSCVALRILHVLPASPELSSSVLLPQPTFLIKVITDFQIMLHLGPSLPRVRRWHWMLHLSWGWHVITETLTQGLPLVCKELFNQATAQWSQQFESHFYPAAVEPHQGNHRSVFLTINKENCTYQYKFSFSDHSL